MIGRIIKGVSGTYSVRGADGVLVECRARGRFRLDETTPLPGDMAQVRMEGVGGYIEEIMERRNALIRPAVSNITRLFMVLAASNPAPDTLMADRLLLEASMAEIAAAVVINKCDLDGAVADDLTGQYAGAGYAVYRTCAADGMGVDALREAIGDGVATLAGQSGAGKTSLVNALLPGEARPVGETSRINRGRHTTRHAELLPVGGGYLVDTPGFSLIESRLIEPETLKDHYPEFAPYEGLCRFDGCQHASEPGCAVRGALDEGLVNAARYERYVELLAEARERWKRRYD